MTTQILSETPINEYQLKDELVKIKKRDKELNFRAQKTEEHLNAVAHVKNANKFFEELSELGIQRLRENHIHKIIDVMPKGVSDLKIVLQGYNLTIPAEAMKKIMEVVSKHADTKH